MSEWNRMRKQNRNLESMILIIIAACFLLGGWCDWNALVKEKAWIFINDIDAFSLTILTDTGIYGNLDNCNNCINNRKYF